MKSGAPSYSCIEDAHRRFSGILNCAINCTYTGSVALLDFLRLIDRKANEQFGHEFSRSARLMIAAYILIIASCAWHVAMLKPGGGLASELIEDMRDPLIGIIVMCIGGLMILRAAWVNVRQTNLA